MSLPQYSRYKDSGVEWFGEVPEHWEVTRLKRVASVFPSNVDKKAYPDETPVKLCNYTDVYYNNLITEDLNFMRATASEEQVAKFTLRAGDTIVTKDSETADDIAISAFVPRDLPGIVCGYHLSMIRPLKGTHGPYIKLLFDCAVTKAQAEVAANGLTRVGLGQYALDNIILTFPPTDEQSGIEDFIALECGKIDALVEEQRRLIELLKEKRQAVISHAVTKGLNPGAPMRDSGVTWLGMAPAGWLVTKLSHLAQDIGDGLHGTPEYVDVSDYYFINGNNLCDGSVSFTDTTRRVSLEEYEKHRVNLDETTLLMSINGTVGNLAMYRGEAVILGKSAAYINLTDRISRDFLFFFLQSGHVKSYFDLEVTGTTISNLSLESIRNLPVVCPPTGEQVEIARYLYRRTADFHCLMMEATRAIDLLQERRAALISAAVTGKIDVRGLAAEDAA